MTDASNHRLRWRGQVSGPFPLETVLQRLDENEIGLWHEIEIGGAWLTLEEFLAHREREAKAEAEKERQQSMPAVWQHESELDPTPAVATLQPEQSKTEAPPTRPSFEGPRYRPRSMRCFNVLGLTLGFLGAHNLYAGYWGTAVAQVLFTALTCWLGFGIFGTWLWAMIELLLVHTDRRGVRMI
jgi:hypothetical protein